MVQADRIKMVEPFYLAIEAPKKMARPLDSLKGKVVGALWNNRPEGDVVMEQILKILVEQYGVKETRFFKKLYCGAPAPKEQLDEWAKQVDAFITGIGD